LSQKSLWDNQGEPKKPKNSGDSPSQGVFLDGSPKRGPGLLNIPPDAPLALRLTPRTFEEFVGQEGLVGRGKALRRSIEEDKVTSMLFWGPPGTGKTALARLIAMKTRSNFRELSAVTSGVRDIRQVTSFAEKEKRNGRKTILFLDEIHRFNKAQQDALLPHVEKGTVILIGATTENPYFAVNPALLSRVRIFRFEHLSPDNIKTILLRAIEDKERGLASSFDKRRKGNLYPSEKEPRGSDGCTQRNDQEFRVEIEDKALDHIVGFSKGDARIALNVLEALYNVEETRDGKLVLTFEKALEITQSPVFLYDKTGDQHYDIISAYIKSMRGSDPDAAIYWLARMLEAGEDPRYIARRLVICASEDVGNADPMALILAQAAFSAVEHIGMPEARIPLAQATIYVALAPKSNASYLAVERARKDVREKPAYPVPLHLRGTGYRGAEKLGHGVGYLYPHDFPGHYVDQQYLPKELKGTKYYTPSKNENRQKEKEPGNS